MRKGSWLAGAALVAATAVVGVAGGRALPTEVRAASDATPCALSPQPWPGVTVWGVGDFSQWPSTTLWQLDPGAKVPGYDGEHKEPAQSLILVESGSLTLTSTAPVAINRAASDGAPEIAPAGTPVAVGAGDAFIAAAVRPELVNGGSEAATYQQASIGTSVPPVIDDPCQPLG